LIWCGVLFNFLQTELEDLANVDVLLCTRLYPRTIICLGELLAITRVHLARSTEIALGADDDARDLGDAAKVDDLVVHDLDHVERVAGGDAVDEYVAVYPDGVLRVDGRVFIL
jgi:hypothetical protein